MLSKLKHIDVAKGIMYLFVAFIVVICVYPFLNVVAYSLSDGVAVMGGRVTVWPVNFQLDAYKEILKQAQVWIAMRVSVIVTISGTLLGLVMTIFAAYALSKPDLKGRKILTSLILFTMYFGGGIIPTFLVVKNTGIYDSLAALVLPSAMNVFNFIVLKTFFNNISMELKEAALIDGASDMTILFKIVIPLSLPILATIGLYYAVDYWNDYFSSLLYIQSPEKFSLQLRLRQILYSDLLNQGVADSSGVKIMSETLKMAGIVVATLPIIVIYPWLQKYFVKGVMIGAIKG